MVLYFGIAFIRSRAKAQTSFSDSMCGDKIKKTRNGRYKFSPFLVDQNEPEYNRVASNAEKEITAIPWIGIIYGYGIATNSIMALLLV